MTCHVVCMLKLCTKDVTFLFATLWEIFVCFVEYVLFFLLLCKKLDVRSKHKWMPFLFILPMSLFIFFINETGISWGIQTALFLCVDLLTVFALFRGSLMSCVFFGSACMLIASVANSIVFIAFMFSPKAFSDLVNMGYPYRLIGTSAYLILSGLLYWYAFRLPRITGKFSLRDVLLFGFSFFLCTVQNGLAQQLSQDTLTSPATLAPLYVVLFSCSNIVFVTFLTQLFSHVNAQNLLLKNELDEKEFEKARLQNQITQDKLLHAVMHDYSNNISVLKGYADMDDLSSLRQHLAGLSTQLQESRKEGPSTNSTFNASFNSRALKAEKLDVPFTFQGYIPADLNVNPFAFGTVLFNLLDNALEAVSKLNPEDAWIRVTAHIEFNKLNIWVRNASNGIYTYRNGKLMSSKAQDRQGFGLTRIHDHAEIIGGEVGIFPSSTSFDALLIIPYEGESTEAPPMESAPSTSQENNHDDPSSGLTSDL